MHAPRSIQFAVLLMAGCTGGATPGTVDGSVRRDASSTNPPPPSSCTMLGYVTSTAQCKDSTASAQITNFYQGAGTASTCTSVLQQSSAHCAAGCAIEFSFSRSGPTAVFDIYGFAANAAVLCAETPAAHAGQACTSVGNKPCLPTRASLNSDGTVAGQEYLRCDSQSQTCVDASPPPAPNYLQPCDPSIVAMYGTTGARGFVDDCLIAWDDGTQSAANGTTYPCIGDWQCPVGALCDDQLTNLNGQTHAALCKPGPRGMLTPAMLTAAP